MKLKPLADRVVLKQNAAEERTASGIFLTSSAQEKPEIYEVVEVGPGGMVEGNEVKMIVTAGQKVLVGKYAKGRADDYPEIITHLRGDCLEIDFQEDNVINVDGEAIYAKHVCMKLIPKALNLIVPRGMRFFDDPER